MGRHKDNGRDGNSDRKGRERRRQALPNMEYLENRQLLSGQGSTAPVWAPTSTDIYNVKSGPLAKAGSELITLYHEYNVYLASGDQTKPFSPTATEASRLYIKGNLVQVDINVYGNLTTYQAQVRGLGMQVTGVDKATGTVGGYLPLAQLPAIVGLAGTVGINPIHKLIVSSVGSAVNQGEAVLQADTAKTQFSVDGTGLNIGVLSDSVSQYAGGLADSVKTGDLPNNVTVLADGQAGGTDEGRAMLEEIHDIATGSNLMFATAEGGDTGYAQNIRNLAAAGANIIVDDAAYPDEPYFQDGIIAQAVSDVVKNNVTYVSSAGNAADSGYQSNFRGANGTVTGVGTGRFMNFDPNGGTALTLGINVYSATGGIVFQYDNPFYTTNGVTSDLDIFILDANNNVVASGTTNNIATQQPLEFTGGLAPGLYKVAIQVAAGSPDVGRISFYEPGDGGFSIDHQYGSAGDTTYAQIYGHHASADTIATGAVPWFNQTPFYTSPSGNYFNEPFSAFGPAEYLFNPDGSRKATPEIRLKPDISAADGVDTSFFPPGGQISTVNVPFPQASNAPYPGQPATVTGEVNTPSELDNNALPNFFGTSAAAPQIAAMVALMRQLNPSATNTEIRTAITSTAKPLNGQSAGTYNTQAGFGLAQAVPALNAINTFHVTATSPANAAGITTAPQYLAVQFNRDVDIKTLNASDLVFTAYSIPGLTITVGQPLVDLNNLKVVFFPLTFNLAAGAKGSGAYAYTLKTGSILSTDGKQVVGFNGSFGVFDTVAPKVVTTQVLGRYVMATFSEPMNPASITKNNFYLIRTGSSGVFGSPTNVVVNSDPRLKVGYDLATNTAILDFSGLDQSQLPSDHYAIVILDTVTDALGNKLDGEFSGIFPSGDSKEGGNFTQDLGVLTLTAPQILSVKLDTGSTTSNPPVPTSDSGIVGDQNTNVTRPTFVGQVSSKFPTPAAGLTVVAEFSGYRGGILDLGQGLNGRGYVGSVDVQTVTDAAGKFSFQAPANLPAGFQIVRVVVVGASSNPPLPGLSAILDTSFRIDTDGYVLDPVTNQYVLVPNSASPLISTDANSLQQNSRISSLTTVTLDVTDPVYPVDLGNPLSVPTQFVVPALNPATATNISNYQLLNLGSDNAIGGTGSAADTDFSAYITSATFAAFGTRTTTAAPYQGRINLNFAPGLPSGKYELVAKRPAANQIGGITDAAGNGIAIAGPNNADGVPTVLAQNFVLTFDLQPTPAYITSVQAISPDPLGGPTTYSGPRSYFELPVPGTIARATAPPNQFQIDFSNPLAVNDANGNPIDYTNFVQLIRSADTPNSPADGDFGTDPTFQSGVGYTRVAGTTVKLVNSVLGATFGTPGYKNRLVLSLPAGTSLPADHYRLYIPNQIRTDGTNLKIVDQFQNQLDGEFLGNLSPNGDGTYENLLPTGQIRPNDLTGDGTPGGAFETGYTVVPNGNVIFARPDYVDDPNLPGDDPDGSAAKPYAALAPEAVPTVSSGNYVGNGGDLNNVSNFSDPNNANYDRNGNGRFDRSAFVAAAALSARGPVVIVAEAASTDKSKTFVLQAPAGTDPTINDGSASVPFDTSLVFQPGSVLKFRNASLFVQNQGSSIQALGGPNPSDQVIFTSYSDDSVGGDTNSDGASSKPAGGDWGGIVLRNYDDTSIATHAVPPPVAPGPVDASRPKLGVSGADEALSIIDHAQIRYGGGAVPQTIGFRYDAITSFNTRATVTNTTISQTGGANSAQAAISGDVDSFRQDDLARGILVRRTVLQNNSINGIYIRAELNGVAEPTDATFHPSNPTNQGGTQNYSFFAPLPYVLVSRLVLGQMLLENQNGQTQFTSDRFYFQPGTVVKFQRGAAIDEIMSTNTPSRLPSLVIGDRTYINQYDVNNNLAPTDAGFKAPSVGDAQVLFTSFFDDNATTSYRDPNTGVLTTIVAPIDSDNGGSVNQPIPGLPPAQQPTASRWGGIYIQSGAIATIDEATFEFGGGSVNTAGGTLAARDVLAFSPITDAYSDRAEISAAQGTPLGTKVYITNNNFNDNLNAAMAIDPNGLLAADPLRPLLSGNPFFRGNVFTNNQLNGLEVVPDETRRGAFGGANVFTNTIWDDTDLNYILRDTVVLAGAEATRNFFPAAPGTFSAELSPVNVLTIQSSLPGTLLANGDTVARPGESAIVKLLNNTAPIGNGQTGMPAGSAQADDTGGAGFLVGIDNGLDPTADSLVDAGVMSQIRIVGISGNQTTGQQRVPVIITSLRDDTVGRTVRGQAQFVTAGGNTTAPAAGDGGVIGFGGLSLSDYNLFDPRDGNIIADADLKYLTRVEQQGGGWVYVASDGAYQDRPGTTAATQFNTAKAMTVSNSNFSNFSQVGFIAHPSFVTELVVSPAGGAATRATVTFGQPTLTFFVNSTFSNMPTGVRIEGDVTAGNDGVSSESPAEAVFLNNTFNNNGEGIHLEGAVANGLNPLAHVQALVMDNIFSNSTVAAITAVNQTYGSQGQYNLFSNNAGPVAFGVAGIALTNSNYTENQPITGLPQYRNAATGDYTLLPNSDAIDSSRSEIGPLLLGTSLQPIVSYDSGLNATRVATGRTNPFGGLGGGAKPSDIISLPGYALRSFKDEWVPALPGTAGSYTGVIGNAGGAYSFIPIGGERDQAGQLRVDDPNKANVGFGNRPFFDIGAFEYVQLNPPHITAVTAIIDNPTITPANPVSPTNPAQVQVDFYNAGGIVGENQTPHQVLLQLDQRLDPSTVNGKTVVLQAAGGDGIFDNGNDKFIDLSGKLIYDPTRNVIVVSLADSGLSLANDAYRFEVFGSGGNVLRNPQGLALDGENTVGGQPNGATLPLPSGDKFPGGNFFLTFTIDTHPPAIVPTSLALAAGSRGATIKFVTKDNTPDFIGTVTDIAPPQNFLQNQTVFIDISTKGDGVYDRLAVATGKTDVNGNFTAVFDTTQKPLPDTAYSVGPDGILGTADDTGYSVARVRIVDQSGNVSSLTDPNALLPFVVDTQGPKITASDPLPGGQPPSSTSGIIPITIAFNENIAPSSLNVNTIKVVRSGGDGVFGNGNDVNLVIDAASISLQNLGSNSGAELLHFNITGATASDIYQVTLVGTGTAAITDIAGNNLDGEGNGFPTGDGTPGGNFNLPFIIYNPTSAKTIFVSPTGTGTGSRANPYPTITAAMAAANPGDTVAVLPGVYTESVALKSLVKLTSAATSSTATLVVPGNALQTIIRAPANGAAATTTVTGDNLLSISAFPTEITGFTISSPLVGNSATGPINTGSFGMLLNNSDVLVDKNYIVDSGTGIGVNFGGKAAAVPRFESNAFVGNVTGLILNDQATTSFKNGKGVEVANNDFAFNTYGIFEQTTTSTGPVLSDVANNIFFQNNDKTTQRLGAAIADNTPNRMTVRGNLFSGNGPSDASPADDTIGVGGGFNPAILKATPDSFGNITGTPAFVAPIDPRPNASGPGNFFLGANYDLQANSAAIDNAINAIAPTRDFLNRTRVDIPNVGHTGYGPADIGAFEYKGGSGSIAIKTASTSTGVITNAVVASSGSSSSFSTNSVAVTTASTPQGSTVKAKAAKKKAVKVVHHATTRPTGPIAAARKFFHMS